MNLFGSSAKTRMVTPADAHPGHPVRTFDVPATHAVLGTPLEGPFPEGFEVEQIDPDLLVLIETRGRQHSGR